MLICSSYRHTTDKTLDKLPYSRYIYLLSECLLEKFCRFYFRRIATFLQHAIKFVGINNYDVRGTCLISKNREHLYPQTVHAIL